MAIKAMIRCMAVNINVLYGDKNDDALKEMVNTIRRAVGKDEKKKLVSLSPKFAKTIGKLAEKTSIHVANETFIEMAELSLEPDSGVTDNPNRLIEASGIEKLHEFGEVYGLPTKIAPPPPEDWANNEKGTLLVTGRGRWVKIIEKAIAADTGGHHPHFPCLKK
ncbi:MAG: hypothetical protein H6908_04980 [Hyphomicrobiales bacterium]|nr:hypothetical protein [Hyphomicrobiales bacterium]